MESEAEIADRYLRTEIRAEKSGLKLDAFRKEGVTLFQLKKTTSSCAAFKTLDEVNCFLFGYEVAESKGSRRGDIL